MEPTGLAPYKAELIIANCPPFANPFRPTDDGLNGNARIWQKGVRFFSSLA
jgi:hypothetical protein